jgi:UDP-N-acetylmuramoylalanine--D-glutamate ligase
VTGRAVVAYCLKHTDIFSKLTVYGGKAVPDNEAFAATLPNDVPCYFDTEEISGYYDIAVISPGIPPSSGFYTSALQHCDEVISEPEFAWRISPERWVGVTGTNGKTTTTMLTAHLFNTAGIKARVAGNIGTPCISVVEQREDVANDASYYIIAELSSYQLYSTVKFAPDVAILLNITPDHLSWHGSHEAYAQAKLKIFANMGEDSVKIRGDEEPAPEVLDIVNEDELQIKGPHNLQNAYAACAAALACGASANDIREGLRTFAPIEHRFEPVAQINGVSFINDSKATNTDAAIKAIESFAKESQLIVMFGGRDKGTVLDDLVATCVGRCKLAVCYGEAGERFYAALSQGSIDSRLVAGFDQAFDTCVSAATIGDTVLLSPACASFDEFACFEARGDAFKAKVAALMAASGKQSGKQGADKQRDGER